MLRMQGLGRKSATIHLSRVYPGVSHLLTLVKEKQLEHYKKRKPSKHNSVVQEKVSYVPVPCTPR